MYDPKWLRGKTVAVTGANRGLGLELAKELSKLNCRVIGLCRGASSELSGLDGVEVVEKFDVTSIEAVEECCSKLAGSYLNKVDCLINNAGYFYGPEESIAADTINYEEELKMIDICALGPLRATSSFHKFGLLKKHPQEDPQEAAQQKSKVALITSQGGSISWRDVQNPAGGDYGHHISKASANMLGALMHKELTDYTISILHPGFCRTDMTRKYEKIWDIEGAVETSVGARRVLHEINNDQVGGKFINCEDGLEIPW